MSLIRAATTGGVHHVELASPPVNALSPAFLDELDAAFAAAGDPAVRAVAITSAVDRVFQAGADLAFLRDAPIGELEAYVARLQRVLGRLPALPVPVVVGVDGACLGGGLELALAADVRIVAPDARLGLPEAQLGILAAGGGTQRLARAIGQAMAHDLLLTGRRLTGAESLACGLASRLAGPGRAGADALALAGKLASGSGPALAAAKRLALASADTPLDDGLRAELAAWLELRRGPDAQEGLAAFAERRAPCFAAPNDPKDA